MRDEIVLRVLVAVVVLLVGAGGGYFGTRAYDDFLASEIAREEAAKVYGKTPDYSKPWHIMMCDGVAQMIALGEIVRKSGARKSAWMAAVQELNVDADPEFFGELSLAWDKQTTAAEWYGNCQQKFFEHLRKQEERAQPGRFMLGTSFWS